MVFLLRKAIPPMGQFDFRYEETPSGSTVPPTYRFDPNTPEYRERFPGIGRGPWTVESILEPRFAGRSFPTKREKPISAAEIFARDMLRIYEKELIQQPGNDQITFPIAKLYLMRANSELEPTHGWHLFPYWRNYPLSPEDAAQNDIYKRTHAPSRRDGGYYLTQQRIFPGGHPKDWSHSFHELSRYRHAFISSMMEKVARNFLTEPQTKAGWIRAKERTWQEFQRNIENNPVQAGIVTPDPNFRYGVDLPNERPFESLPKHQNMEGFDESTPMAHPWFWQSLGKSRADFDLNNPDPFPIQPIDFREAFWLHPSHFNRNNQIRDPFENIRMLFEKERPYWSSSQNLENEYPLETAPIPIIGRGQPGYTDQQLISTALRIFNHPSFRGSMRTGRVGGEETTGNPMDGVNLTISRPRVIEDGSGMFLGYEDAGKPTAKDFVPVIGDRSQNILEKIQNSSSSRRENGRPSWLPEVDSRLSAEDQFEKDFQDTARIIAERDRSSQIARLSHSNRSKSGHEAFLERRDNPLHDAWGTAFAQGASWLAKKSQELGLNYTEKEFWDEFHQEIQNKHAEIDDSIGTIKLPQIPLESLEHHISKINDPSVQDQIKSDIQSGNYEISMDPNAGPAISSDQDPRNMGPTIATKLNSSDFGDHPFADDSQLHQEISHGLFADRDHEKFNSSVYRVFPHIRYATPSGETKIMSIPIGLHEGLTEMDESKPMTDSAKARLSKSINSALNILKTSPSQIKKAQRFESNGQVLMEEDPGNQMAAFGAMNALGSLMSSGQNMISGVRDAMNQSSLTSSTSPKPRIGAKRISLPSSKNAGRDVQIGTATPGISPPRVGTAASTTAGGTPKRVNSGLTGPISSTQAAPNAANPALPAPNLLNEAPSLSSSSPPRVSLPRRPSPPRLTRS